MLKKTKFFVIDFDRCLSNTELTFSLFIELLQEHPLIDTDTLQNEKITLEAQGGSFDVLGYLRAKLSKRAYDALLEEYVHRGRTRELLAEGARDLLAYLDANVIPYGIVSYGSVDWQELKFHASGIDAISWIITSHPSKAHTIGEWYQPDGRFVIPLELHSDSVLVVNEIILLDDKAIAFDTLPLGVRGYWVCAPSHMLLPAQQGTVPPEVITVYGLAEVIQHEKLLR